MRLLILIIIFVIVSAYNMTMKQTKSTSPIDDVTSNKTETKKEITAQDFINRNDQKILMSLKNIQKYNDYLLKYDKSMNDLKEKPTIDDITKLITKYQIPSLPQYNNQEKITTSDIEKILDNRNLEHLKSESKMGIIIKRANLKSFPTTLHFYDKKGMNNFDNLQESELQINTPVLIVHTSKDERWYYVITPNYTGWVLKEAVALTKDDYFINPANFVIITAPSIKVNGVLLDMGVRLPLIEKKDEQYVVALPIKNSVGMVQR